MSDQLARAEGRHASEAVDGAGIAPGGLEPAGQDAESAPAGLVGLVRGVDAKAWRHTYGVGEKPKGMMAGELGALRKGRRPDLIAVRLATDGRLVTDRATPALARPRALELLNWVVRPAAWRRMASLRSRAAIVARRARAAIRRPWRRFDPDAEAAGRPLGFIHRRPAPGTNPLYSAVHPITGDQLLTTTKKEVQAFGYGEPALLGHLVAAAPVTGTLGPRTRQVPWARFLGLRGLQRPAARGAIQQPTPADPLPRDAFRVVGWAVLDGEATARVEIFANGRRLGRARIALPPPARRTVPQDVHAQLAGFQHLCSPDQLPAVGDRLQIEAVVTGTRGTQFVVATRYPLTLVDAEGFEDGDGRAAVLRSRGEEIARRISRPPADGLNLLAVTHRLTPGGAQRYLYEQLRRLARSEDFSCTVVAAQDGPWRDPLEAEGIEVHVRPAHGGGGVDEYEGKLAELAAWLSYKRFNAVFANTIDSFGGVDLADRAGIPCAWTIHESFELPTWWLMAPSEDRHPYVKERCSSALGKASALLFPADATRDLYGRYAASDRLITTPLGLEQEEIDDFRRGHDRGELRRRLGIDDETTIILCLGIVEPRKAQALLARAYELVCGDHPKAHLALVGGIDTGYGRGLGRYLKSTLEGRASLIPATMEPYPWHAVADLFVLPSDIESSPIVLLEAMAFETPVLATRVFGVPELITEGRDGYLCEANDVADMAAALDRILKADPEELEAVGRAGARRVRERHDPEQYAANLDRLLRRMLENPEALPTWELQEPRS
jgi:D-inositol-3-phosphate glycosyltransferase